jgi:uncharacterized protein
VPKQTVAVLGASDKRDRYSNRAVRMLLKCGHEVIPVHPVLKEVCGLKVIRRPSDIKARVDTITLYVGPERLEKMIDEIIALKPGRIIANPGAESEAMKKAAEENNIEYMEACTLVMLQTGQF